MRKKSCGLPSAAPRFSPVSTKAKLTSIIGALAAVLGKPGASVYFEKAEKSKSYRWETTVLAHKQLEHNFLGGTTKVVKPEADGVTH